jgi:hypothetical protein
MTTSPVGSEAVAAGVLSTLVGKFALPVLLGVFGWGVATATMRFTLDSKADQSHVDALRASIENQRVVLARVERRQLILYCREFPQSFECLPSERP